MNEILCPDEWFPGLKAWQQATQEERVRILKDMYDHAVQEKDMAWQQIMVPILLKSVWREEEGYLRATTPVATYVIYSSHGHLKTLEIDGRVVAKGFDMERLQSLAQDHFETLLYGCMEHTED